VNNFLKDESPEAWEKVVDRLLASPQYGVRWGRHWLDIAGYAESDGNQVKDLERPYAWHYRDYVVQSMNDAASRGDLDTVKARMEQMPQARSLYTTFNSAGARLSEINKQMDVIRNNPTFTPDRKTELLEKLRKAKGDLSQQLVNAAEKVGVTR
jgi:hypothetical protein